MVVALAWGGDVVWGRLFVENSKGGSAVISDEAVWKPEDDTVLRHGKINWWWSFGLAIGGHLDRRSDAVISDKVLRLPGGDTVFWCSVIKKTVGFGKKQGAIS